MLGIATDVSDPAAVEQLFARTVQRFGRVDLLFNNAGRGNPPGSFLDWTPEQWREVVDVNLNGMFYCLQQAFRTMRDQSPRGDWSRMVRSEEHTSELQSRLHLVCRLLLE